MTLCGQIKPARHALLQLLQAGGGSGLIRRVAATARIDPRPVTRGLKNQNIFFFLREPKERTEPRDRRGSRRGDNLRGTSSRHSIESVKSRVKPERSIHLLRTRAPGQGAG